MERYFHQGSRVLVIGRVQNNNYTNKRGEKIYGFDVITEDAGTELTTLTTTEDGTAKCTMALPLMDQTYSATNVAVTATSTPAATKNPEVKKDRDGAGNDDSEKSDDDSDDDAEGEKTDAASGGAVAADQVLSVLNSGDYYLKEISVPDSYYLDAEPVPVHLEYKDADTRVISLQYIKENKQTTNEVDKVSAAGSEEIDGCELVITDPEGNEIIRWISGDKDSVKVSETAQGYVNLKTSFDENGNLHVGGLFHDMEYTLTETRPADGYVTADSIVYMLKQSVAEDGTVHSVVSVKQEDGTSRFGIWIVRGCNSFLSWHERRFFIRKTSVYALPDSRHGCFGLGYG